MWQCYQRVVVTASAGLYNRHTMPQPIKRSVVLMRDASSADQTLFIADLYLGKKVENSVYLDRAAMLDWIKGFSPNADTIAARAMSELLIMPELSMIDIPLTSLPVQ